MKSTSNPDDRGATLPFRDKSFFEEEHARIHAAAAHPSPLDDRDVRDIHKICG
jgi:hypothetical protein